MSASLSRRPPLEHAAADKAGDDHVRALFIKHLATKVKVSRRWRTESHLTMRPPMWPGMIMRTGKPWSGVSHLPFCLYAT